MVLSHLLWNTGQVMPIAAVAEQLHQHPQQPYLLVDAAQSFGQMPVENAAAAADIYAFTGHKWPADPKDWVALHFRTPAGRGLSDRDRMAQPAR